MDAFGAIMEFKKGRWIIMIRSYFDDLRRKKEFLEKRDLTIRIIADETGLSQGAILRIKNVTMERLYLSTVWTLCRYFGVKSICELIEFTPDEMKSVGVSPRIVAARKANVK